MSGPGEVSGPIAVLDPETTVSADRPWNGVVWMST